MEKKFRRGEVVWAKVRGFPWWPAVVKSINIKITKPDEEEKEHRHTTVLVYFIGDNSHSELPLNKVEKFSAKFGEFTKTKKRSLLNSIKLAEKIISNELSFEKHLSDLNKNEKGKNFSSNEKSENEIDLEDEIKEKYTTRANFLGLKRRKRKLIKNKKSCLPPKIDFCVEDDFSKNIKINININVNNNTNNTLNITTIGKKIIEDESEHRKEDSIIKDNGQESSMQETDNIDENIKISEDLKEAINSLLFYKINMPSSTSNKSIIGSLEEIQNKLQIITGKKHHTYELIKDLIPILTSFLCSRNQMIVTKSSELFSIIKEKILEELFEVNHELYLNRGDGLNVISNLKNNQQVSFEDMKKKLADDLEGFKNNQMSLDREGFFISEKIEWNKGNHNNLLKKKTTTRSSQDISQQDANESLSNINEFDIKGLETTRKKINLISTGNSERDIGEIIIHESDKTNFHDSKICNEIVSSNSITTLNINKINKFVFPEKSFFKNEKMLYYNKKKFSPLNPNQIRFLFKGFIGEDDVNLNFQEKLSGGIYSNNFYKSIYTKYNGLSETLACKRKHVCIKLLQILKLFLPDFESEELKKTIIFLEYKIRTKDPTLGKIYKENLEAFYDRLKEILSLATESLNNLSKQK